MRKFIFMVGCVSLIFFIGKVCIAAEQTSEQKFQGFNLQGFSDNGTKSWDVKGDTANVNGAEVELSNVNANSYGEQNINVTAEKGKINQTSGKMRLEKDVVITSDNGQQMFTDSLDWDREKDHVTTNDDVVIADDKFTASGKGMDAKPGLKSAKIKENVTVMVDPKKGKSESPGAEGTPVTITSDGPMTIDQGKRVAIFEDNVVAIQLDRTLKADRMEIYFNEEMNDIQRMECIGNVEIVQGENKSYAQKATYTAALKKMVLSGRPKIIMQTQGDLFATSRD